MNHGVVYANILNYMQHYLEQTDLEKFNMVMKKVYNEEPIVKELLPLRMFILPEFFNIRHNILYILANHNLSSKEDFMKVTEGEVLGIRGIGRATINTLKEKGVRFKN
ncbi:hypothetical protein IU402_03140 [Aerococcaceae bacterium zg-BR9]|uniref:hypothetical protein n=1 Tax=Aerococcaceae bacterium zg-1292 TaxID=2774330 RepID=UPI004063B5B2|nr:hypothetical protein [Aerococcaceae bacterium zg-BR9]MBF6977763.1 hypothetical protein [Aerococcaceae bacterium zg-BR22]